MTIHKNRNINRYPYPPRARREAVPARGWGAACAEQATDLFGPARYLPGARESTENPPAGHYDPAAIVFASCGSCRNEVADRQTSGTPRWGRRKAGTTEIIPATRRPGPSLTNRRSRFVSRKPPSGLSNLTSQRASAGSFSRACSGAIDGGAGRTRTHARLA